MPELPEVETIRLQLTQVIMGKTIKDVEIRKAKLWRGDKASVIGKKVIGLRRFSKLLILDLTQRVSLAIHLKMTGRLVFSPKDESKEKQKMSWEFDYAVEKHTHVIIHFTDGSKLFFHDLRQFGYIQVVKTTEVESLSYVQTLGPEFFRNLSSVQFKKIVERGSQPIKLLLMDQQKVAGVGNIYANEALWCAKINPKRKASTLSVPETVALFGCFERILRQAIRWGGASDDSYRNAFGGKGEVQEHFLVYNQEGCPCQRCHTPIKKITLGGRGTYFCPKCQAV